MQALCDTRLHSLKSRESTNYCSESSLTYELLALTQTHTIVIKLNML